MRESSCITVSRELHLYSEAKTKYYGLAQSLKSLTYIDL